MHTELVSLTTYLPSVGGDGCIVGCGEVDGTGVVLVVELLVEGVLVDGSIVVELEESIDSSANVEQITVKIRIRDISLNRYMGEEK